MSQLKFLKINLILLLSLMVLNISLASSQDPTKFNQFDAVYHGSPNSNLGI